VKNFLLSVLGFCLYISLRWTWRVEIREPVEMVTMKNSRQPFLLAHWHGDELALLQLFSVYKIATIVSTSKDGEIMNRIVRWMGAETTRGSSTRGGVGALKGLFRLIKQGWNSSFAVDGPKGPIYKVKPGIFEVSKRMGLPVFAAGVHCDRAFLFPRSWNKTYLPKPFAKITVQWLGPWGPVLETQDPKDDKIAIELENLLIQARKSASNLFAVKS
jgi:lysophospholipid acyltransferase (LPLAT)-like uncharacterized protein